LTGDPIVKGSKYLQVVDCGTLSGYFWIASKLLVRPPYSGDPEVLERKGRLGNVHPRRRGLQGKKAAIQSDFLMNTRPANDGQPHLSIRVSKIYFGLDAMNNP
jgi:hypothetical protein